MPKYISQVCSAIAGVAVGAVVTTAVIIGQPDAADRQFDQLKSLGFDGGVYSPGVDKVRVTVGGCGINMHYASTYDEWTLTTDDGRILSMKSPTPAKIAAAPELQNC